jgi:hypothetical protein
VVSWVGTRGKNGTEHPGVAVVRETGSSTRHLYIDGSSVATSTAAALDINLNSTAVDYVGDTTNYNGTCDAKVKCFLAYNRHLSSGEILALLITPCSCKFLVQSIIHMVPRVLFP